jgi:hypothetical protein
MTSFDTRFTDLPASLWQHIAQIDEIKGEWRHASGLGPQLLGRLKRSVLVTSTGASTRIEGARLSDAVGSVRPRPRHPGQRRPAVAHTPWVNEAGSAGVAKTRASDGAD